MRLYIKKKKKKEWTKSMKESILHREEKWKEKFDFRSQYKRNIGFIIHRSTNLESERFLLSSVDIGNDEQVFTEYIESYCWTRRTPTPPPNRR